MIHERAMALIVHFEGCLKKVGPDAYVPYRCPAGVPTVGIGSIWRADGTPVAMTDPPITRAEAERLMAIELAKKCIPAVRRMITVPLHPLSHGSLVSFVYNAGGGALQSSGLRRAINGMRWDVVPHEFAKWRIGGGRVLPGLVRRRKAEAELFMDGVAAFQRELNDNISVWRTETKRAA